MKTFIRYLKNSEFEKAYDLTDKGVYVGCTIEEFKKSKEIDSIINTNGNITIKNVYPRQTIFNRAKRIVEHVNVEPEILNIELRLYFPFTIQMKYIGKIWVISKFGAHAG